MQVGSKILWKKVYLESYLEQLQRIDGSKGWHGRNGPVSTLYHYDSNREIYPQMDDVTYSYIYNDQWKIKQFSFHAVYSQKCYNCLDFA